MRGASLYREGVLLGVFDKDCKLLIAAQQAQWLTTHLSVPTLLSENDIPPRFSHTPGTGIAIIETSIDYSPQSCISPSLTMHALLFVLRMALIQKQFYLTLNRLPLPAS
jgi:hypothetical protein